MGLPYFPLYVTDYEADTAHLTLEEDGVYMRLLRLCWRTAGCSIPADPKWIARHMRVTWEDFERVVSPILSEFFKIKSGRYYSPRLTQEAERISVANSKRKIAGSKGGTARALKYKENVSSNAIAMLKHPEPEPEPDIYTPLTPLEGGKSEGANVKKILTEWASEDAVSSFMAYRRKTKGKALTVTAAKRLATNLKEIFNAGGNTDDALGLAEERGWQSVKPEWYFNSQQRDRGGKRSGTVDAFAALSQRLSAGGSGIG